MDEVLTTREKILSILKYSLISLIASIICGVIVGLLDVYSKGVSFTEYAIRVFADAFKYALFLTCCTCKRRCI